MFRGGNASGTGGSPSAGQNQGYLSAPISALGLHIYIYMLTSDISFVFEQRSTHQHL